MDTPGVTTKIDYHEFLEYGMGQDEAVARAREATEGVAEAMHWLREDIDGVIYVLDSTQDPFMHVNIMMVGIIESRKLPVIIVANKIDLPDAAPQRIKSAFPQHPVVMVSGLEGNNMDDLYAKIAEVFRRRKMIQGVQIDMLSSDRLSRMTSMEKIRLILDDVRQGSIVVLEKGLTPEAQG